MKTVREVKMTRCFPILSAHYYCRGRVVVQKWVYGEQPILYLKYFFFFTQTYFYNMFT